MRAMERGILHVDMDAFYASVEQLDDPSLRGKPVIVGGHSRRGVVAAASYEVRKFGVRSAMSMVEAMQRCPHAVVVSGRMERYQEVSDAVFDVFHRYTPIVEGLSLDEAFLDVTGSRAAIGDPVTIAKRIKQDIFDATGLRGSAGVAPNKFVAKVASDLDKPDGLVVVAEEGKRAFLAPLKIERMWGVGPKAAERLHACGFHTFGDLASTDPDALESLLGSWGRHIHAFAHGIDDREVVSERGAKSLGAEQTFEKDRHTAAQLEPVLLQQSARVAGRLSRLDLRAQVVTLKIKYGNHRVRSRQMRLPESVADTDSIYDAVRVLLAKFEDLHRGIRLTGVSVGELTSGPPEPVLFPDERKKKREQIEALTQALGHKFGSGTIVRGTLVDAPPDGKPGGS